MKKYSRKFDEFWVNCDRRIGKFQWNCKKTRSFSRTVLFHMLLRGSRVVSKVSFPIFFSSFYEPINVKWFLISHFAVLVRQLVFSWNVQEDNRESFSPSFSQHQRWSKLAILRDVHSDWFAISRNSSQNSAQTCRNARNDKCIASFRKLSVFPVSLTASKAINLNERDRAMGQLAWVLESP